MVVKCCVCGRRMDDGERIYKVKYERRTGPRWRTWSRCSNFCEPCFYEWKRMEAYGRLEMIHEVRNRR